MIRTPALVSAAAALGVLAGLALEARAGTLRGEVSPHTVSVAWMIPGPATPAGVELDERGRVPRARAETVPALAPMRARVPAQREVARKVRHDHVHGALARTDGCPREPAHAVQPRRS